MELNSIINNNDISTKMQDIYKYIEKNDNKFKEILDKSFEDIKNLYKKVEKCDDGIEIFDIEDNFLTIEKEKCYGVLGHHANAILDENSHLLPYAFKINIVGNIIQIVRKR